MPRDSNVRDTRTKYYLWVKVSRSVKQMSLSKNFLVQAAKRYPSAKNSSTISRHPRFHLVRWRLVDKSFNICPWYYYDFLLIADSFAIRYAADSISEYPSNLTYLRRVGQVQIIVIKISSKLFYRCNVAPNDVLRISFRNLRLGLYGAINRHINILISTEFHSLILRWLSLRF